MDDLFANGATPSLNNAAGDDTASDSELRRVKELIQTLLKTKRAFEMYPSNNPILLKFQEDILKKFEVFFEESDRLILIIRQHDILYKGQAVYHSTDKDDNLARMFFKDGLRELSFTSGFSGDEVLDFIDVMRVRPETSTESFDDDVVTRLWEKDFLHLTYYVVEEFAEGTALEEDEVSRILSRHQTTDGDLAEVYQDASTEEPGEGEDGQQIFSPLESISMGFKGVFSLGEEEVKSLKEEMERLTDENFLLGAINALFESLYIDRDTPDFGILMDNLDSALGYLVRNGVFGTASLILDRFRGLMSLKQVFSPAELERINASVRRAADESAMRSIADVLNSGKDVPSSEFQRFLNLLDRSSLVPLSNLLGEIQDIKYRKSLIEVLVSLGRDNIDALAAGVRDKRDYVVKNVVTILGRIGDKAALEHLKQTLKHPEISVRREVVRALGMIGGPKAGDTLLHALEDQDPQIRMSALRYLPNAQSYAVLDGLLETINRPDFSDRALAEKRAFFEVLSEIGQDKVLPLMTKLLKKSGFFSSASKDELRACAAYGLGNIHKMEALEALKKELGGAKKGSVLAEAISYSIHKLSRPAVRAGTE
ncbi:MAG: HEAT repeat domain-containing protein [Nitrospirae bacterium]|nr:HEAT repeat domain-containing protein [Nitrospirota bacterium]